MTAQQAAYIGGILMLVVSAASFFWDTPVRLLSDLVGEDIRTASVLFVFIMFLATVVAPLTTLPLVPLIAPVLGPFTTGLLSIIGWTLGAVVAFLIARHAGRPLLGKLISLEAIAQYETYIPQHARFWVIVMLRMMIPVDILSYALGLLSTVPLLEYTVATVIGISWFAFAFAYLGDAAIEQNYVLFAAIGALSLIILVFGWGYVLQRIRKNKVDL